MKRLHTRLGSILLVLAMLLALLPVSVLAGSTDTCLGGEDCSHQAAIGSTHYDTLTEALAAAEADETVTLLTDIDNSLDNPNYKGGLSYILNAGTTLDGAGHTLSGHIGVHIPAAGATVTNVEFRDLHNDTEVKQSDCDKYGWDSKIGNQSAIYAADLAGTATITNCTFDNIDWDAIQITPTPSASIVVQNNVFRHSSTTGTQLRYLHIERKAKAAIGALTVTDNQFFRSENPEDQMFCAVAVFRVSDQTPVLELSGNYLEDYSCVEISNLGDCSLGRLFPARSQADRNVDDYQPVAYDNDTDKNLYPTLQDAVDRTEGYIRMIADTEEAVAIPADKTVSFYSYGHTIGTLTNNGALTVYGDDLADTSRIVNHGLLTFSNDSATVYEVENHGTLEITRGETYNLSRITGEGDVSITGGTFSTRPAEGLVARWHKVTESGDPASYRVSKMSISEAVEAGAVAGRSKTSSSYCYTSVTEAVNFIIPNQNTINLWKDVQEDVRVYTEGTNERSVDTNGHSFTGTISIEEGAGALRLYGTDFTLERVTGEKLAVGAYSTKASAVLQDADLEELSVSASGSCTVEGGQYRNVVAHVYYKNGVLKYTAQLSITGGAFARGTVTVDYANHVLENGADFEEVPLSNYVAPGYTVVAGTGDYPYRVVPESSNAAAVVPAAPSVDAPDDNADAAALAHAIEAAEDLVAGSGLDVAAGTEANENTLNDKSSEVIDALAADGVTPGEGETVTIVIQPYMDVEILELSQADQILSLAITPKYNVVATTADLSEGSSDTIEIGVNAAIVKEAQTLTVTQPVTVSIPLPNGFLEDEENVYVKHTRDGVFVAYHEAAVSDGVLTFTNDRGFSEFEVVVDQRSVQVTFGPEAQPVTLRTADVGQPLPTPEIPDGQRFRGWQFAGVEGTYTVLTEALLTQLDGQSVTASAVFQTISHGGVTTSDDVEEESAALPFTDVSGHWALDAIAYVYEKGMMTGTTATTFSTEKELTRGMLVTILHRLAGEPAGGENTFSDVADGQYYAGPVAWAAANGIVTGYPDGTFAPDAPVTREQLAAILYRYAQYQGMETATTEENLTGFADGEAVSAYAVQAMNWAVGRGLITGVTETTLVPGGTATRAQVAAILMRYCEAFVH